MRCWWGFSWVSTCHKLRKLETWNAGKKETERERVSGEEVKLSSRVQVANGSQDPTHLYRSHSKREEAFQKLFNCLYGFTRKNTKAWFIFDRVLLMHWMFVRPSTYYTPWVYASRARIEMKRAPPPSPLFFYFPHEWFSFFLYIRITAAFVRATRRQYLVSALFFPFRSFTSSNFFSFYPHSNDFYISWRISPILTIIFERWRQTPIQKNPAKRFVVGSEKKWHMKN